MGEGAQRTSGGFFELGKTMAVATKSGLWHWKSMPLLAYSRASDLVKFSTNPLVDE